MRKCVWKTALVLFLLFLPFSNPTAEAGTGSIRAKIVLPGDTGTAGPLSIGIQPMGVRPLESGDGGGGDGGGGNGGDGGGGGDGGYWETPYSPIASVKILEDRILNLENLNEGLKNLLIRYEKDLKDDSGNVVGKEEFQLSLKNIRVVENQVTDLKDLMLKKGGTINGSIKYAGRTDFPTATVHVVGFAGTDASALPPWMNNRTITATDLSGNFTLTNLPEGTYALAITPGGDAAATHAREVITNIRAVADQTITATPFGPFVLPSTLGLLKGKVKLIDKIPSGPFNGTTIRATSTEGRYRSYIQVTGSDGTYDFGSLPLGKYNLYVQHPGYKVYESPSPVEILSSGGSQGDIYLEKGTKLICGRVTLSGADTIKGDIGNDRQINLTDAILALQVHAGLAPANVVKAAEVDNDGRIGLSDAFYAMQTAAGMRTASSPLAGTLVMIPGTALLGVTDSLGNFLIENVPETGAGNWLYDLFVTREGYKAYKKESVTAQDTCNYGSVSLALLPNVPVTVAGKTVQSGSIVGRTWLKNNPDPSTINIVIENTGYNTNPNGTGNFTFNGDIPPGTYNLRYSSPGYKTVVEAGVLVAPNRVTETRNVVLIPRNGTVKGRITLEDATDYSGIPFKVEPAEAQVSGDLTVTGGYFSIPVPENFDPVTNQKCVLDSTPSGSGGCTSSTSYKVVIGGGTWAHSEYVARTIENVNVPAGETVDLGTVELKKAPEPPSGVAAAQNDGSSITVSWTASLSTDVAGYNVYYGTRSDQIDQRSSCQPVLADAVNKVWHCTVTALNKGVTYYFLVKAIDNGQLESIASQHVAVDIIPLPIPNTGELENSKISNAGSFAYPTDVAVSQDNLRAFVTNSGANLISVLDLASYTIIGYYEYTYSGYSNYGRSLVSNPLRPEVYVLADTTPSNTSLFVISTVDAIEPDPFAPDLPYLSINPSLSEFSAAKRAIVSPDGRYLFISQQGDSPASWDKIFVIDLNTRNKVAGLENGIALNTSTINRIYPLGMAIANNKLYVGNEGTTYVSIVDINPGSPTAWQKLNDYIGDLNSPKDVAASADGRHIYIANTNANESGDDEVAVYDTTSKSIVKRIPVKNSPNRLGISGDILFVLHEYLSTVVMISTITNEALGTTFTTDGTGPKSIAFTHDGQKILITDQYDDSLTIRRY